MNSTRGSSYTRILYRMLDELGKHKRSRSEILNNAVRERLNESFKNYYNSVMRTYEKLEYEDGFKLMKKLNKM